MLKKKLTGDYNFFFFILNKYKNILPFSHSAKSYLKYINYNGTDTPSKWRKLGVNPRAWLVLEKDLIICNLTGKIKNLSFDGLINEFNNLEDQEILKRGRPRKES